MRVTLMILLSLLATCAQATQLRDVRLWDGPDSTRVVFDLEGGTEHKFFTLDNPSRVVIDIAGAKRAPNLNLDSLGKGLVKSVRTGPRDGGLRVVLDLSAEADPKSFGLEPNGTYGYRLIFDLFPKKSAARTDEAPADAASVIVSAPPKAVQSLTSATSLTFSTPAPASPTAPTVAVAEPAPAVAVATVSKPARPAETAPAPSSSRMQARADKPDSRKAPPPRAEKPLIIAIDAGHGGEDPGARGRNGVIEKDVTLRIARKLAALVDATPGYRAVLVRKGDYFIPLRERTAIARRAQADLFISIHANSLPTARDIRGSAVYVLSQRGASSEHAKMLANLENSADLVGGVELSSKADDLASVLLDISQTAVREASFDLGSRLLESLGTINELQKPEVQQAGFAVLKSPDIPSALVETAFLSHPEDERLLSEGAFQESLAETLMVGIKGYFSSYRPQQQLAQAEAHAVPVAVSLKRRRGSR